MTAWIKTIEAKMPVAVRAKAYRLCCLPSIRFWTSFIRGSLTMKWAVNANQAPSYRPKKT